MTVFDKPVRRRGMSVTQRIKSIKQPYGGYVRPKSFEIEVLGPGMDELYTDEQTGLHPITAGLAVDYMTRFMAGTDAVDAFRISIKGAQNVGKLLHASGLINDITGLDDASLLSAVRLVQYDQAFRAGPMSDTSQAESMTLSPEAADNLRVMIQRGMKFFEEYGPVVMDGFTMEGGYTNTISTGDGDFLTEDTLWDFKVSKSKPTSQHALQLLIYWRMGLRSIHPEFQSIKYLGIFNPKRNEVYKLDVTKIDQSVIDEVERNVIGY